MLTQTFNVDASGNSLEAIVAGSAIIGKVGIDQTTPGTTDSVTLKSGATIGLVAGAAIVGKVGIDQTTPGTTNLVQVGGSLPAGTAVIGHVIVDSGTISTSVSTSATGTITSVAGSITTAVLLASNVSRKGFTLYNDSTAICKVAFAATATSTAFTFALQPNAYFENNTLYTGVISGIWASAAGSMRATELT